MLRHCRIYSGVIFRDILVRLISMRRLSCLLPALLCCWQLSLAGTDVPLFNVHGTAWSVNADAFRLAHRRIQPFTIPNVAMPDGEVVSFDAQPFSVLSTDAVLVEATEQGDKVRAFEKMIQVRCTVRQWPGSYAVFTVFPNAIWGYVERSVPSGTERYVIQGGTAARVGERLPDGFKCFAEDLSDYQQRTDSIFASVRNNATMKRGSVDLQHSRTEVVEIATECAESYYKAHGGTLSESAQYAVALMGAVSGVYERDANVAVRIPFLRIWTTADPYAGEIGVALGKIRDVWENNMKYVRRSTTVLLSNSVGGGLAWVGVLCSGFGYNVSGLGGAVNFPAGGYLWDIDVTSHELGHNIGSSHTHNCGWAPAIDSCWNAEGGCYSVTKPRPGSIMAYCHLTPFGNQLLFHPRVASLFRAVTENRACTSPTSGALSRDVAATYIELPAVGGTIGNGQLFAPTVWVTNTGTSTADTVTVRLIVSSFDGSVADTIVRVVNNLAPNEQRSVTYAQRRILTNGQYIARVDVFMTGDQFSTNDQNTRPFEVSTSIGGALTLLTPKSGDAYTSGDTVLITWSSSNVKNVRLEFSSDGAVTWKTIQTWVADSLKKYTWVVPAVLSSRCHVRVAAIEQSSMRHMNQQPFRISLRKDIQAIDVAVPSTNDTLRTPGTPRVVIRNNGAEDLSNVRVSLRFTWAQDANLVYNETIVVPSVRAGAQDTITMPATPLLAEGVHLMWLVATVVGDQQTQNDSIGRSFISVGTSPPMAFSAQGGHQRAILTWKRYGTSPITAWEVYRTAQGGTEELIATLQTTVLSYVDLDVANGVTYTYVMRGRNGQARTVPSAARTVVPKWYPAGFALTAPRITSPVPTSGSLQFPATLAWENVRGAEMYQVQVAEDVAFARVVQSHILKNTSTLTLDAPMSTTRYCRVRCFNNSDNSPWSEGRKVVVNNNCSGKALQFTGVTGAATNADFAWNGGPVTVEFWTYVPSDKLPNASSFSVGDPDVTRNRFQAHVPWSDKNLYWDYGNLDTNGRLVAYFGNYLDKWTHVALVSNGTNFSAIYLDGEMVLSSTKASSPTALKKLTLGANVAQWPLKGSMDEFRIWSKVRTREEIRSTMNASTLRSQTGLVGWWRCDEGTGSLVRESTGKSYTLTMTGEATWTASGASINCTATGVLATPKQTAPMSGQQISVMHDVEITWIKVNGADRYEVVLSKDAAADTVIMALSTDQVSARCVGLEFARTYTWSVRALSGTATGDWATSSFVMPANCTPKSLRFDGKATQVRIDSSFVFRGPAVTIEFWNFVGDSDLQNSVAFSAGTSGQPLPRLQAHAPWSDKKLYWDCGDPNGSGRLSIDYAPFMNKWTHVALTSNGRDRLAIYCNGVLIAEKTGADSLQTIGSLVIGARPWENLFHRGRIDNFRVWNVERSEGQIRSHMSQVITGPESGLLGSWPMKEGAGSFIYGVDQQRPNDVFGPLAWQEDEKRLQQGYPMIYNAREAIVNTQYLYSGRPTDGRTATWTCTDCTVQPVSGGASAYVTWTATGVKRLTIASETENGCADSSWYDVNVVLVSNVGEDVVATSSQAWSPTPTRDHAVVRLEALNSGARAGQQGGEVAAVSIDLFDVAGAHVRTLFVGVADGTEQIPVNTSSVATGTYRCVVRLGSSLSSFMIIIVP